MGLQRAWIPCLVVAFAVFFGACGSNELPPEIIPPIAVVDTLAVPEQPKKICNLQPVIDTWLTEQSGTAGIVVYDLQSDSCVGRHHEDSVFFSASIYKLFVAYEGYLAIQQGMLKGGASSYENRNREECLDAMIRSSDSPCGQRVLAELGGSKLDEKLKSYGIVNTSLKGLKTTAADVAVLLKKIHMRAELSAQNTDKLLNSMLDQPALFRSGLPRGFRGAIVHNKVGWNEPLEWHDAALVTLDGERSYAVVVLTRNIGCNGVTELGRRMMEAMTSWEEPVK